jgi:hypothetical protein
MTRALNAIYTLGVFLLLSVLSLNLLACSSDAPTILATLNQNASIVGNLPANPLQWKVISSEIDQSDSTMSTLYGNDLAVEYARGHSQRDYPAGSVLSLVTWKQLADPRWFGAKIPDQVKFVEFVTISITPDGHPSYSYEQYAGLPLKISSAQISTTPNERAAYLLAQRAAVMP